MRTHRPYTKRDGTSIMSNNAAITPAELEQLLDYNPETGSLRWKVQMSSRALKGSEAGNADKRGYRVVQIHGRRYMAHRIAWALSFGAWPDGEIDHKNCDPSDNRLQNIRDVSPGVNKQNSRAPHADSKTGLLGVTFHKRRSAFMAQIFVSGKNKFLGFFDTAEEAHAAYVSAKREAHTGNTL